LDFPIIQDFLALDIPTLGNNPLVSINGGAGGGGGPNAPGGNGGPVFAPTFIFAKAKGAAQQG